MNSKTTIIVLASVAVIGVIAWQSGVFKRCKTCDDVVSTQQEADKTRERVEEKEEKKTTEQPAEKKDAEIKSEDIAVAFKQGIPTITKSAVENKVNNLPERLQERMSMAQARTFVTMIDAVKAVLLHDAIKHNIGSEPDVIKQVKMQERVEVVNQYIDKIYKDIDDAARDEEYGVYYNEKLKGEKSYKCIVIATQNGEDIKRFAELKSESDVRSVAETMKKTVAVRDMNDVVKTDLLPELREALENCSASTTTGPVNMMLGPVKIELGGGQSMFCAVFVISAQEIKQAKKCPEHFRRIVMSRILQKKVDAILQKNDVRYIGPDGKEIARSEYDEVVKKLEQGDVKNDSVIATVGKEKITVGAMLINTGVEKGVDDPEFVQIVRAIGNGNSRVAVYRMGKRYVEEYVLLKAVKDDGFDKTEKCTKAIDDIRDSTYTRMFLVSICSTVTEGEIQQQMNAMVQEFNSDPKNKQTYSVKMLAFKDKSAAENKLKEITSGKVRFTRYYEEISKNETDDVYAQQFENATRRGMEPSIFSVVSVTKPGTCAKQVVELDGRYVLIYVANIGQIAAPNMKNPPDRERAKVMAKVFKGSEIVKKLLLSSVTNLDGVTDQDELRAKILQLEHMIRMIVSGMFMMRNGGEA